MRTSMKRNDMNGLVRDTIGSNFEQHDILSDDPSLPMGGWSGQQKAAEDSQPSLSQMAQEIQDQKEKMASRMEHIANSSPDKELGSAAAATAASLDELDVHHMGAGHVKGVKDLE